MFNAKQAIIINYAPGGHSSALAIDTGPPQAAIATTNTTTTTTATTATPTTAQAYKSCTCLAFRGEQTRFGLGTQLVEKKIRAERS